MSRVIHATFSQQTDTHLGDAPAPRFARPVIFVVIVTGLMTALWRRDLGAELPLLAVL